MTISLKKIFLFILAIIIFVASWYFFSLKIAIVGLVVYAIVLAFAHKKRKRPSTYQKHTNKRAGEIYDKEQNGKRGKKNKKYKKKQNPNKNQKE